VLWSAVECCGVLWSAVECCGVLWSAVECCGVLWSAVECCGVLWSAAELVPFVDTATSHVFAPSFLHSNHLTVNRFRQYPTVLFLLAPSRFRNVWFRALFAGRTSVYGRRICLYDRTTQPVRMR
jgi:hypothetical protein